MTFDNFVDIQTSILGVWVSDGGCCGISDQPVFPVNGVAVLRHQTPNLHCCSPDYHDAIMDGVSSLQSQLVEHIRLNAVNK